ncbi:MAG: hypothetical protein WA185_04210 [Candidatus Acidiferrales bacterium]
MRLPAVPKSVLSVSRAALICAVSLGFAAAAPVAFAQRGAGGGGGSHGGGGGGGHVSGGGRAAGGSYSGGTRSYSGSAGRSSGASSGRYGSSAPVYASGASNRGYSRTFFVPGPSARSGSASSSFVGAGAGTLSGSRAFAANNYYWQNPPQQGRPMPAARPISVPPMRPVNFPGTIPFANTGTSATLPGMALRQPLSWESPRTFDAVSPRLHQTPVSTLRHPIATGSPFAGVTPTAFAPAFHPVGRPCIGIGNPCFGSGFGQPFLNPFFFSGFGFGFGGGCFSGGFVNSCGIAPFGLGLYDMDGGLGYDYGDGYFYPTDEEPPPPPDNSTEDNAAPDFTLNYYFMPPPDEAVAAAPQQPVIKLVLKDGTIFGVYSYWLDDDRLNYITTYNIQTSIPIEDLDLQKTVDLNEKLGVTFTLSNKPPDQQPPPQPPDGSGQ